MKLRMLMPIVAVLAGSSPSGVGGFLGNANPYIPNQAFGYCGDCYNVGCPFNTHGFLEMPTRLRLGGTHFCHVWPAACPHGPCNTFAQGADSAAKPERALAEARAMLEQGGGPAVKAALSLLNRFPTRFSLNEDRQALQLVAGCNSNLMVAHVPLRRSEFHAIAAELPPSTVLVAALH